MKRITAQVAIGGSVTESAANTFTESTIQIPLSAVDRQGFVIQECYIQSREPDGLPGILTTFDVRVTKTSQTGLTNISNPMMVTGTQKTNNFTGVSSDMFQSDFLNGPTSEGQGDYLTILATENMFVSCVGLNNAAPLSADVRIVGYFATLSSDEYNALVLDELQ